MVFDDFIPSNFEILCFSKFSTANKVLMLLTKYSGLGMNLSIDLIEVTSFFM